jgi:hypothetical protein
MGLKTINKTYLTFNIIRIFFALLYIFVCVNDLYEIKKDPETYERVYTGEFLGKYRYNSLDELKKPVVHLEKNKKKIVHLTKMSYICMIIR